MSKQQPRGLGVTRTQIESFYGKLGFRFGAPRKGDDGLPTVEGKLDTLTRLRIAGPQWDVQRVELATGTTEMKGDEFTRRQGVLLSSLISLLFPDWEERHDWLMDAMQQALDATPPPDQHANAVCERDGRRIKLLLIPGEQSLITELSVRALPEHE